MHRQPQFIPFETYKYRLGSMYLKKHKLVKIIIAMAVLLFVLKPFLGYTVFSGLHPSVPGNIFIKVFSKGNLEDPEKCNSNVSAIQKNLAGPDLPFTLLFTFLLSIIFPAVLALRAKITNRFLGLRPYPGRPAYLLNGKLTI